MTILTIAVTALSFVIFNLYRRHRPRPMVHHVIMAEYLWQPRKLK